MKTLRIALWVLAALTLAAALLLWGYVFLCGGKGMKDAGYTYTAGGPGYEKEGNAPAEIRLTASASSQVSGYSPAFAVDGDIETYWEGTGAYPQTFDVALSEVCSVKRITIRLNPIEIWGKRTMRFSVAISADGTAFTEAISEKDYILDWENGNETEILLPEDAGKVKAVRLVFTANSGAGGGQIAEFLIDTE